MQLDVKRKGDVFILRPRGDLMGGPGTISLHEKVVELVNSGSKKIVINLSEVKWMNASGLGTIMAILTTLKKQAGNLKIASVNEKAMVLFMATKLNVLFDTYKTEEEAIKSFKD